MLTAENITLYRGGAAILDYICLSVRPGRLTAILGPNGAGKSSLLACLSGLERPDGGRVLLDDADVGAMPVRERARHIGLLPQSGQVHWDMKVHDLVALGRFPYRSRFGMTENCRPAIDCAMAVTGTSRFSGRQIFSLSGGERARVLLARLLAGEPQWLLADEPLANLDPAQQLEMMELLQDQAKIGHGVAVILHDLGHAAHFADDIILMHGGRILATGAKEDVLTPDNLARAFGIKVILGRTGRGRMNIRILGRID